MDFVYLKRIQYSTGVKICTELDEGRIIDTLRIVRDIDVFKCKIVTLVQGVKEVDIDRWTLKKVLVLVY